MSLIPEIASLLKDIEVKGNKYQIDEFKDDDVNYSYACLLNAVNEQLIGEDVAITYLEHKRTPSTMYWLGVLYECIKKDNVNASKYYKLSIKKGNTRGSYRLGCLCELVGNLRGAFSMFKLSVTYHKDPESLSKIGIFFYDGLDTPREEIVVQDYKAALECFKLSDKIPASQYYIGTYYEFGLLGYKKDLPKAYEYYHKSANEGYSEAQYAIGYAYHEGCTINRKYISKKYKQDYAQALKYLELSAEQNHKMAIYRLGGLYMTHEPIISYKKALLLLLRITDIEVNIHYIPHKPSKLADECEKKLIQSYRKFCDADDYTFACELCIKHKNGYEKVLKDKFITIYTAYLTMFYGDVKQIILTYLF